MKKVYIAILTSGNIRFETARWLINRLQEGKYDISVQHFFSTPVQSNRNQIVRYFLNTDFDYLVMLDHDIVPNKRLLDLIEEDKEIISGLYCGWNRGSLCPFAFVTTEKGKYQDKGDKPFDIADGKGIIEVDRIGAGALIIKREVLEKLKTPFAVIYDEGGIAQVGEDFEFCRRAQEAGYKIWVDMDCLCNHLKTVDLAEIYNFVYKIKKDGTSEVGGVS